MPLKILHAADAAAAADKLATQLRNERGSHATLFLVTDGLKADAGRNDILREALAAANDGSLLVVHLDDAPPPVGTRDAPSVEWSPDRSADTVRAALRKIAPKSWTGFSLGCLLPFVTASLTTLVILSLNFLGDRADAPMRDSPAVVPYERPPLNVPDTTVPPPARAPSQSVREAVQGRWASTAQQCPTDYLQVSRSEIAVQASNGDISDVLRVAAVDEAAKTITLTNEAGASIVYRLDRNTLSTEQSGRETRLTRCIPSSLSRDMQTLETSIGRLRNSVSAVENSMQSLEAEVRSINNRTMILMAALFAVLMISAYSAIRGRPRSLRTRKTTRAESNPTGALVVASYSRQDGQLVDQVVKEIERGGVAIWMDKADIGAGATWSEEIVRAIRESRGLILFCSEHAFESDHVLRELNLADSCRKPVYPILLEPVAVPDSFLYYLSTRQLLDVKNDPDWKAKLTAALAPNVLQIGAAT